LRGWSIRLCCKIHWIHCWKNWLAAVVLFDENIKERLDSPFGIEIQTFNECLSKALGLTLPNSEHLGATRWACSLGRWPAVLHCYALWVFHLLA